MSRVWGLSWTCTEQLWEPFPFEMGETLTLGQLRHLERKQWPGLSAMTLPNPSNQEDRGIPNSPETQQWSSCHWGLAGLGGTSVATTVTLSNTTESWDSLQTMSDFSWSADRELMAASPGNRIPSAAGSGCQTASAQSRTIGLGFRTQFLPWSGP